MIDLVALQGIPYGQLDCYGLVRKAFGMAGVALPDYRYPGDDDTRAEMVRTELRGWIKVERPRPMDVILLRVNGKPVHLGLVVGRGRFLHSDRPGTKSRIDRWSDGMWQVEGFYRCPELA